MEELIRRFLAVGYGYGDGDGDGCGDGDDCGSGYGDDCGSGCGSGCGYGSGYGSGYGDGNGSGNGSGNGDGDGYGYGYGLSTYNGQKIYMVDNTATLIDSVHGQYAKGNIIKSDLTLYPCYIARCGNYFAHGDTIESAKHYAEAKLLENEPLDERIERFKNSYPDANTEISNAVLYEWHNVLTGSCEVGRKVFAKEHGIDIENGSMTVREFINLTKNAFGCDVIKQLKEMYNL